MGSLQYEPALVEYPKCVPDWHGYSVQYVPALIVMYPEFGPVWHGQC